MTINELLKKVTQAELSPKAAAKIAPPALLFFSPGAAGCTPEERSAFFAILAAYQALPQEERVETAPLSPARFVSGNATGIGQSREEKDEEREQGPRRHR